MFKRILACTGDLGSSWEHTRAVSGPFITGFAFNLTSHKPLAGSHSLQFGTAQLLPGYYLSLHYGVEWSGEAVTAGEATTLSLVFDCGCIV
ncbi:hypothetical protein Y1Q_0017127 [Alligator mississippiensis]|uniref:Uncharacterized protein n=1 Tax=Alligator mississippiensis TaxID=8496 RepID=A0A151PGY0_ALLMI|nr:hypothetical protein Y1Q_0017127 [Alligator mississippiensis]